MDDGNELVKPNLRISRTENFTVHQLLSRSAVTSTLNEGPTTFRTSRVKLFRRMKSSRSGSIRGTEEEAPLELFCDVTDNLQETNYSPRVTALAE
ncbi:unnamed protein product [Nesidiocoris tenuis]|uniref:Uncharacterized protein n=1 Tax=Nesidiocoris tenuis TaxID=355587 RepID=A0A6H5GNB1_9HEMI|nr:unnamed protein product [Nesidiocoris tenuis]